MHAQNAVPTLHQRVSMLLAALLVVALSLGFVMASGLPARAAATGDYAIDVNGPESIALNRGFSYDVTLTVGASLDDPVSGIVLTTQLPVGLAFESVPTGGASPVESFSYDPSTRTVTFIIAVLTEQLAGFSFAVVHVDNEVKDEKTSYTTTITGTATPSGTTPADTARTDLLANFAYDPDKRVQALAGSGNRIATYFFNVGTRDDGPSDLGTFTTWGQRLSDTFPAGVEIRETSDGWTVTANPDGSSTAAWERDGQYGPSAAPVDPSGSGIWITVAYPVGAFPTGSLPPKNTVGLQTQDHSGTWHDQSTASVQGPALGGGVDERITVVKGADSGRDSITWGNGIWTNSFTSAVSYLNDLNEDSLESLTVTDTAAQSAANADFFDHVDVYRLAVKFNGPLSAAALPYTLEYATSGAPSTWKSYVPATPTTAVDARITVQTAGSTGFQAESGYSQVLDIPVGEHLTGWRVVVSPDDETTISSGAEVRIDTGVIASYGSLSGGSNSDAPLVNTSTAAGTNTAGAELSGGDELAATIVDRVNIVTSVTAPTTLSVGGAAAYEATVVNLDPSGRSYSDAFMRIVLPVGVYYDAATGAAATSATTVTGHPVPQVDDGVTVSTETVTDADGEHQVVVLRFDRLDSERKSGEVKSRSELRTGPAYTIPVIVQPAAYTADGSAISATAWASTLDPAYTAIRLGFYPPYLQADEHDFDPYRPSIASRSDSSIVITAGGLLLGKLVRSAGDGGWASQATVASPGRAEWQVYAQNILPQPVSDIVLFDRLPAAGDGRASEFPATLSGPVTGAPATAVVEYSADATSADSGTWSADPAGATAFRVTIPSLATGGALTLEYPTTVPPGLLVGQRAVNDVTATGVYNGADRNFSSTEASLVPEALPALSLVKKTNGVEYESAPGAVVPTGSLVTWTYVVTNTGNTLLDDIAIEDAFTAGDGSTGSLAPTSAVAGPLAPGDSRTFTATAPAVEGQYANTATASASAVDDQGAALEEQPAGATDSSWYLAGRSGLTVTKLTNGQDVTSAPGPPLVPGSDVEWTYVVTNAGSLDLRDVDVVDIDVNGDEVFSDSIAALAAGQSVTLTSSGTAIDGQYENTVTASAADPSGGANPVIAADTSWYFGVVSSIAIDKSVSAVKDGPPAESVTVSSGADVWWTFVVTNTGNASLANVIVTDTPLGDPIELGDLAPGESATSVVREGGVTAGYTNVAQVDGTDRTGAQVSDDDDATVAAAPAAEASADPGAPEAPPALGLAVTGGTVPVVIGAVAVALLLVGGLLLVSAKRRRARS